MLFRLPNSLLVDTSTMVAPTIARADRTAAAVARSLGASMIFAGLAWIGWSISARAIAPLLLFMGPVFLGVPAVGIHLLNLGRRMHGGDETAFGSAIGWSTTIATIFFFPALYWSRWFSGGSEPAPGVPARILCAEISVLAVLCVVTTLFARRSLWRWGVYPGVLVCAWVVVERIVHPVDSTLIIVIALSSLGAIFAYLKGRISALVIMLAGVFVVWLFTHWSPSV